MYINKISFKNFRQFSHLEMSLEPKLNVFVGVNGSGKTALLEGVSLLLSAMVANLFLLQKDIKRELSKGSIQSFKEMDIKIGETHCELDFEAIENDPNSLLYKEKPHVGRLIYDKIATKSTANKGLRQLANFLSETDAHARLSSFKDRNLPIIAFYRTDRTTYKGTSTSKDNAFYVEDAQIAAYFNALSPTINNFDDFTDWFEEEESYEDKRRLNEDNSYRNPKLEGIREALIMFTTAFKGVKFTNLRIRKERFAERGRSRISSELVISQGINDIPLSILSAGEKMILMLVTDVARRLSIANPSLENPLNGNGVVLIDEIDLHLHPQWQMDIIPALTKTFPNIQFLITTHSEQVVSLVKQESIFILDNNDVYKSAFNAYAKDSNSILKGIFDIKISPFQDKIDRMFSLIAEEKFEEAQLIRQELQTLWERAEDPIFTRADALIWRRKALLQS